MFTRPLPPFSPPRAAFAAAWARGLRSLLAGARAVVTPDSGAAHVAGMLGVPCIAFLPPVTGAAHDLVRWKPWAGPARTLVATELVAPYGALLSEFVERVRAELVLLPAAAGVP